MEYLEFLRSYSPTFLIVAGVLLLIVPKWIRIILAVGLIFIGVTEMYPELLTGTPPATNL